MNKLLHLSLLLFSGRMFLEPSARPGLPPLQALNAVFNPKNFITLQTVTLRAAGCSHTFSAAIERRGDDLQFVGLIALGNRLFTLSFAGGELNYVAKQHFKAPLDVHALLQDFYLCHMDLAALKIVFKNPRIEQASLRGSRSTIKIFEGMQAVYELERESGQLWHGPVRCGSPESIISSSFHTVEFELGST